MDWNGYSGHRESDKVYNDAYTADWGIGLDGNLIPQKTVDDEEKQELISVSNSNKYNICQTIAETFGLFVTFKYRTAASGKFMKAEYTENGKVWTGKKVVFTNKAIHGEDPLVLNYQNNLQSISRTADTTDIYTKMYVMPVQNTEMTDGYVTIANTTANPSYDEFILNFDYLYSIGSISDAQLSYVKKYLAQTRQLNIQIHEIESDITQIQSNLNRLLAETAAAEKEYQSAQQNVDYYQALVDDTTFGTVTRNKDNAYSAIFRKEAEYNVIAHSFSVEGIDISTIKIYSDSGYTNLITQSFIPTTDEYTGKENGWYVVCDEFGYAKKVFQVGSTSTNGEIYYCAFEYAPANKYAALLLNFQKIAQLNEEKINKNNLQIEALESDFAEKTSESEDLRKQKDDLNLWFERVMGPALREGYWNPNDYDVAAQHRNINLVESSDYAEFIWDNVPFEGEDQNWYYASVEDEESDIKTYYDYLPLTEDEYLAFGTNPSGFQMKMLSNYQCELSSQYPFAAKNYYILIDNVKYYFTISSTLTSGTIKLEYISSGSYQLKHGSNVIALSTTELTNATNATIRFTNSTSSISLLSLSDNGGFNIGFMDIDGTTTVVLILNQPEVYHYDEWYLLGWNKIGEKNYTAFDNEIRHNSSGAGLIYPRIHIKEENVNYDSDNVIITVDTTDASEQLVKYYDYTVILRDLQPYYTFKVDATNYDAAAATTSGVLNGIMDIKYLMDDDYHFNIKYDVSRANEQLYIDAKQVAYDNSIPRYSYNLSVANMPHKIIHNELGRLVHINDYSLGIHNVHGYISGIKLALDNPSTDELTIQNYKTKFEDLFGSIAATNEAMQTSKRSYDVAAASFNPNGTILENLLQKSLYDNDIMFAFSGSNISITNGDGILVTNTKPYANGIYGKVAIRGGGVFVSSQEDAAHNPIWNTAITPTGINATAITTGQLNTENIKIYSGNTVSFQWNSEGLFAYKNFTAGEIPDAYICYNKDGLIFHENDVNKVELSWNGLILRNNEGVQTLWADPTTGDLRLAGTLQSLNYIPEPAGAGWCIEQDGHATFNDITVRGAIEASAFKYEEVSSVGGQLYITPTITVEYDKDNPIVLNYLYSSFSMTVSVPLGSSHVYAGRTWNIYDVVVLSGNFESPYTGETYTVRGLQMMVSSITNTSMNLLSYHAYDSDATVPQIVDINGTPITPADLGYPTANKPVFITGVNLVYQGTRNGTSLDKYGLLLNAAEENTPYLDVWAGGTLPKVRVGNLAGITPPDASSALTGYGLYGENVYLTGTINATGGKIGSLTIAEVEHGISEAEKPKYNTQLEFTNGYYYQAGSDFETTASVMITPTTTPTSYSWTINYKTGNPITATGSTYEINIDADDENYPVSIKCTITIGEDTFTTPLQSIIRADVPIVDISNYRMEVSNNAPMKHFGGDVTPQIIRIAEYEINEDGTETLVPVTTDSDYSFALVDLQKPDLPIEISVEAKETEGVYTHSELSALSLSRFDGIDVTDQIEIRCLYAGQIISRSIITFLVDKDLESLLNVQDSTITIDGGKITANSIGTEKIQVNDLWAAILNIGSVPAQLKEKLADTYILAEGNQTTLNTSSQWLHFEEESGLFIGDSNYKTDGAYSVQINNNGLYINQYNGGTFGRFMSFAANATTILNPTVNGLLDFNEFQFRSIELSGGGHAMVII